MSVKLRLIIMNFLQYAIWGSWLISFGGYLSGQLHFSGKEIGSFYATMGIASLFMPAIMGIIADRWVPAQKLLGISHLISAVFLVLGAQEVSYAPLYTYMLLAVFFYMPTIALSNSVAYCSLNSAGLDTVKSFPPIRVWGTVGFVIAMNAVEFLGFTSSHYQLYVAAGLGVILSAYSFSLPCCPTVKPTEQQSWVEAMGLKAFSLFKEKRMAIFFIFCMLLGVSLQITNAFANDFLTQHFGKMDIYKDSFGVTHANTLISLSQVSETLCILLIPFVLKRFGIKSVMLMSMFAWVLRFGLLGAGNPGDGVWMLIASMLVYGVAFDFFNISGSLFIDNETDHSIRSSAQGLFMIMTNGFGAFIGSYAAGAVVDYMGWPISWYVFAIYALVVGILFALLFKYKHNPDKINI